METVKTEQKIRVECVTDLYFTFDENSEEFKSALESYRAVIDPHGDRSDMINHVSHNILRFGSDTIVEGVGRVMKKRDSQVPEMWSGITVDDDEPDFDFEIYPG